ncbi:MAG: divergent PAP2 family protein [Kiritimatiellia bacterium]
MTLAMGIIRGWSHLNAFEIIRHPWFVSAFLAGGLAQVIKLATMFVRTRRLNLHGMVEPGGMPSAHSALVTALAVAVGLTQGFDAPEAMIAVGLGTITMADAVSIRRAAGEHARLLNRIVKRLDSAEQFEAERLRERLGHTRMEVVAGVVFGACVAIGVCGVWDFWK